MYLLVVSMRRLLPMYVTNIRNGPYATNNKYMMELVKVRGLASVQHALAGPTVGIKSEGLSRKEGLICMLEDPMSPWSLVVC
jgi:hypothetical protein